MPLVSRYVDPEGNIQERFMKFIHCDTGMTGEALKDKILFTSENEFGLDIKNFRGQCYDGAGNMAGKYSGFSTRIKEINDLALYTHCASLGLNLCVATSCQLQSVRNFMDNIQNVSKFFNNSPKRQLHLGLVQTSRFFCAEPNSIWSDT